MSSIPILIKLNNYFLMIKFEFWRPNLDGLWLRVSWLKTGDEDSSKSLDLQAKKQSEPRCPCDILLFLIYIEQTNHFKWLL